MSDPILVAISNDSGIRVPSLPQLNVIEGHSVTFHAVDEDTTLFFSPDLIGILTPGPDPSVSLAAGQSRTFTFSSADPGAYEILFQTPEMPAPQAFGPPAADHNYFLLFLKSGSGETVIVPPPMPMPALTSNPIQALMAQGGARGITSNPIQTLFGEVESESASITSNPIQT